MAKTLAELLAEASDPQTPTARLKAISNRKRESERTALREVLAANPNIAEDLLWELAIEFPAAVVSNPLLQLIQLRESAWWTQCGTGPLLSILSVMGAIASEQARSFLFKSITDCLMLESPFSLTGIFTMSFSEEISVEWSPQGEHGADSDCEDDSSESEEFIQNFTLDFKCSVESYSRLEVESEPAYSKELYMILVALLPEGGGSPDLDLLADYGWSVDSDSMDDGYWELDSHDPSLPDWDLNCEIMGDGSGTVTVTDPTGLSHEIMIGECNYDSEDSTPTLDIDLVETLISRSLDAKTFLSTLKAAFLLE